MFYNSEQSWDSNDALLRKGQFGMVVQPGSTRTALLWGTDVAIKIEPYREAYA